MPSVEGWAINFTFCCLYFAKFEPGPQHDTRAVASGVARHCYIDKQTYRHRQTDTLTHRQTYKNLGKKKHSYRLTYTERDKKTKGRVKKTLLYKQTDKQTHRQKDKSLEKKSIHIDLLTQRQIKRHCYIDKLTYRQKLTENCIHTYGQIQIQRDVYWVRQHTDSEKDKQTYKCTGITIKA